ncbi:MAG: alpha/beta hydrolase [Eggerthellaceae bacterium]|jgi:acetyl esterase
MKLHPFPGYEAHTLQNIGGPENQVSMEEIQAGIAKGKPAPGTTIEDIQIPGPDEGQQLKLHVITPANLPDKAPIIMDIHGGGWISGQVEIDDARNLLVAENLPGIVVSVDYRLSVNGICYPKPLEDCIAAWMWLHDHAAELGGDPDRMGIMGTSSGGNLSAGLQLWIRDHELPQPKLVVLVCAALKRGFSTAKLEYGELGSSEAPLAASPEYQYLPADGSYPPYYAFPGYCPDLSHLGPTMVIAAEYDPLRTEDVEYACRLLSSGVPCEMYVAPRVSHGYCVVDHPLMRFTQRMITASFRREFGMETVEF